MTASLGTLLLSRLIPSLTFMAGCPLMQWAARIPEIPVPSSWFGSVTGRLDLQLQPGVNRGAYSGQDQAIAELLSKLADDGPH